VILEMLGYKINNKEWYGAEPLMEIKG